MRSPDPMLPSITFVLSQAQPATTARRRGRFSVRRSKSSPSLASSRPHPPRYPPQLDSEFLQTVDYRFSDPPPRAPSRSSFALDIFDTDTEIEIVMPSPTESEHSSTTGSSCSTVISSRSSRTRRQRTWAATAFMQHLYEALRSRRHRDASRAP